MTNPITPTQLLKLISSLPNNHKYMWEDKGVFYISLKWLKEYEETIVQGTTQLKAAEEIESLLWGTLYGEKGYWTMYNRGAPKPMTQLEATLEEIDYPDSSKLIKFICEMHGISFSEKNLKEKEYYTKEDMDMAYKAGEERVNENWNDKDGWYRIPSVNYYNFEEWFEATTEIEVNKIINT